VQLPKRMHRGGWAAFIAVSHQISFEIERFHATFDADQPALLPWCRRILRDQTLTAMIASGRGADTCRSRFRNHSAYPCHDSHRGKSYGLYHKRIYSRFSSKSYTSNQT
jgi:hypothetical protein